MADIRSLVLSVTSRCNLSCGYCYLDAGRDGHDMTKNTIDLALGLLDKSRDDCHIQITGGEPTLVPEKVEYIARCNQLKKHPARLAIQSNGTRLNGELVELCREYDIEVGVSLDGLPDIQERQRGQATATLRGLRLLEEAGLPFRVTCVVTGGNALHLDQLALLLAGFSSCRGIGLDLLVDKGRAKSRQMEPPEASELHLGISRLARTLTLLNRKRQHTIQLRELDMCREAQTCGGTAGLKEKKFCHAATGRSLAVTPDGCLYPCAQTMYDRRFILGTVAGPKPPGRRQLQDIYLPSSGCRECGLAGACPGDCPSRLHYNRGQRQKLICSMYQALAEFCSP